MTKTRYVMGNTTAGPFHSADILNTNYCLNMFFCTRVKLNIDRQALSVSKQEHNVTITSDLLYSFLYLGWAWVSPTLIVTTARAWRKNYMGMYVDIYHWPVFVHPGSPRSMYTVWNAPCILVYNHVIHMLDCQLRQLARTKSGATHPPWKSSRKTGR